MRAEETSVKPGNIIYIPVEITDENGIVEGNADTTLKVKVEGGELLAFGSANPRSEETFIGGEYTTFYGKALAVVKAGNSGKVKIYAEGQGLGSKEMIITV
jgi:hypothetical protein